MNAERAIRKIMSPDHPINFHDDGVTIAMKKLFRYFSISVLLWLLSAIIAFFEIIIFEVKTCSIYYFLPLWLGSIFGLVGVWMSLSWICASSKLIATEQRQLCRLMGYADSNIIEYRSLPLLRTLLCWAISLSTSYVLIFLFQCLLYQWLQQENPESPLRLWDVCFPVIIVYSFVTCYLLLKRNVKCLVVLLLGVEMVFTLCLFICILITWTKLCFYTVFIRRLCS